MSVADFEDSDFWDRWFWQSARQNSAATMDRFVPQVTYPGGSTWAVVDAYMEIVVATGLSFYAALWQAEELSCMDKISRLHQANH